MRLRDEYTHELFHRPAEDGMRGLVTDDGQPDDHRLFVLYQGRARECRLSAVSGRFGLDRLPLGRRYRLNQSHGGIYMFPGDAHVGFTWALV